MCFCCTAEVLEIAHTVEEHNGVIYLSVLIWFRRFYGMEDENTWVFHVRVLGCSVR